eukprot:COSAG05_NODE_16383_length_347_cov_0.838710_1_plen_43_part_10
MAYQNLVHVRPHQIVELVQNPVDDFHQQVALLVLERLQQEGAV